MVRDTRLLLFDHHQGSLRPTPEDQALLTVVERHFEGMDAIALQIEAIRLSRIDSLRVVCTPDLAPSVCCRRWCMHSWRRGRGVHLKLETAGMSTLQAGLRAASVDWC